MKNKKLLVLALTALFAASCGNKTIKVGEVCEKSVAEYLEESEALYNKVYAEFSEYYQLANNATTTSEKYAYQAVAEAKLLETGCILPGSANGGNYAISHVVPYSNSPCYWGQDNAKYHTMLIVNERPLTGDERNELKAIYAGCKGSGTYDTLAKAWLAGKGLTVTDTYNLYYTGDPTVYDIHNSYYAADSEPIVLGMDGLYEYDQENVQKPALALSHEVTNNEDGTVTYTFTIRDNAVWTDQTGNKIADVCADDFEAGFQHMLDCAGGLEYLVQGVVKNASEYLEGKAEWADVGCKADGNKVSYTLVGGFDYFLTMLSYSIFSPLCRSYYTSKGGKFGKDFDSAAADYTYGKGYDSIAYCGPYLIKSFTPENSFEFVQNDKYYDKDSMNITKINMYYNDGSVTTRSWDDLQAKKILGVGLNTQCVEKAKAEKVNGTDKSWFDTYAYVSACDANSYPMFINANRQTFAMYTDNTAAVSQKNEDQKKVAKAALANVNFRLALAQSIDRKAYYSPSVGEELALTSATNSYCPGTFVSLSEAVSISVDGQSRTYPAGTWYGKIMQDQIDADGFKMKVFDSTADGGIGSGYGYDGWYNVAEAQKYLDKALADLQAAGTEVTTEKPIVIDIPCNGAAETSVAAITAMAQSIEASLKGFVKVNVVKCVDRKTQLYSCYYPNYGMQMNYDIGTVSGWGPDYGDPQTYLDCFLPSTGGMAKSTGIY